MGKMFLIAVFVVCGCTTGDPCTVWKIQPGKDSIAAKYVLDGLSTIKVRDRVEDEDFDDFAHELHRQAMILYGYKSIGTFISEQNCLCYEDSLINIDLRRSHDNP